MPDESIRAGNHKAVRINLEAAGENARAYFKLLMGHIRHAFDEPLWETQYQLAGYSNYEASAHNNWESTIALLDSGKAYITDNAVLLETKGMPAGFITDYAAVRIAFGTLNTQFLSIEEDMIELRDKKIKANNKLYKTAMSLMEMRRPFSVMIRHSQPFHLSHIFSTLSPREAAAMQNCR